MDELAGTVITRVDSAVLRGIRPRVVGCNARLPTHGQHATDPICRIHTDAGITGWGWCRATEEAARRLVGRRLDEAFSAGSGTADEYLAFDFPLWDLAGHVLGESVHAMLGDAGRDPVPVYDGSIYIEEIDPETRVDRGIEPVLEAVRMGLDAGFRALKVKVGRGFQWMEPAEGLQRDIQVLHAIRALVGPDVTLMIDANNGYTPEQAREVLRQAGECDIYWFEEPFPEDERQCVAFREFIRGGGRHTLLADGEGSEGRAAELTGIVRAGGLDVVQFDMRGFTLTRWLHYLPQVVEMEARAAPHNWGSHLAGFCIQQFARGCSGVAHAETDLMVVPGVDTAGYQLVEGMSSVPHTPGFGLGLDNAAFEAAQRERGGWCVKVAS